jgi:hypothetical protein
MLAAVLLFVVNRQQASYAAHCVSPPVGPEYRSAGTPELGSGVTLRDLIERGVEGS